MLKRVEVSISKVLEIIKMSVQKNKIGILTYLNSDEESFFLHWQINKVLMGFPSMLIQ